MKLLIAILNAALLLAGTAALAKPAPKTVSGWKLIQRSSYAGNQTIYCAGDQALLHSPNISILVKVKQNKVYMFHDENRTVMEISYPEWKELVKGWATETFGEVKRKGKVAQIAGLTAQQYFLSTTRRKHSSYHGEGELWAAKGSGLPPKLLKIMADSTSLPVDLGLPLRLRRIQYRRVLDPQTGKRKKEKRTVMVFNTKEFSKFAVPLRKFKVPSGYRKVDTEVELFLGPEDMESTMPSFKNTSPAHRFKKRGKGRKHRKKTKAP